MLANMVQDENLIDLRSRTYAALQQQFGALENSQLRRLANLVIFLDQHWIPVSYEKLRSAIALLEGGDFDQAITLISTDIGSLTYALRYAPATAGFSRNLTDIFHKLGEQNLLQILQTLNNEKNAPDIEESSKLELILLREIVIAAAIARLCAEQLNGDAEGAWLFTIMGSVSRFFLLKHCTSQYRRSISKATGEISHRETLDKELGFPSLYLSAYNGKAVCQNPEAYNDLADSRAPALSTALRTAMRLRDAGLYYAQAASGIALSDPKARWTETLSDLKAFFGSTPAELIDSRLSAAFLEYGIENEVFTLEDCSFAKLNSTYGKSLPPRKCCIEKLQTLRLAMESIEGREDLFRKLTDEIVHQCGFSGGAIYLINPETTELLCTKKFGELVESENYSDMMYKAVRASFRSRLLLSGCCADLPEADNRFYFTDFIGEDDRIGAIYLEADHDTARNCPETRTVFKAIREIVQTYFEYKDLSQQLGQLPWQHTSLKTK